MIPMLSDMPVGAQAKIRQALGLLGEALIEIAGTDKDRGAQGELFTAPVTAPAEPASPPERSVVPISNDEIEAVRKLAGTMPAKLIGRELGITYERVRYLAKKGRIALHFVPPARTVATPTQPASQASPPPPAEAAPDRTHGAVEASESADETAPATGPDESLLPSSGPALTVVNYIEFESGHRITATTAGPGLRGHSGQVILIDGIDSDEQTGIEQSEAEPSTLPDAATAPDILSGVGAEDGAAAPLHIVTPTAAPSAELDEKPSGTTDSSSREPEAASPPAATEGEVAAEAATSHTKDPKAAASQAEERQRMIAEARQAVALRKPEPVRPRMREPVKTAMQPVSNDWVRMRHKDGRWLSMDGLCWLDGKAAKRENAYLCQRKQLPAVRAKFPLARECLAVDEPKWTPKDIGWARGNT